jgi:hypothetical protein
VAQHCNKRDSANDIANHVRDDEHRRHGICALVCVIADIGPP